MVLSFLHHPHKKKYTLDTIFSHKPMNTHSKCTYLFGLILLFLGLSHGTIFSQRYSEKGDRYFENNLFEDAIKYYELEISKGGGGAHSEYARKQLAECYRLTGDFAKAEDAYRKILKSKKNRTDAKNFLNYGNALKSSAKFEEAKVQFIEFINLMPDDPIGPLYLASCDSAQKWLDETMGKTVRNMTEFNSELSDFSPVFMSDDILLFSSSRKGSKEALISFNGGMEINHMDFYTVSFNDMNQGSPQYIKPVTELNSIYHEGPSTFSADGSEVYFTRTMKGEKNIHTGKIVNRLQILYSKKDSTGTWSLPVSAFHFNSTKYSVGHPSLSKDGKTLFFMSDMRNGEGKTDIYYCTKTDNNSWSDPINLGKEVNTFGYELFPYIADNGILYFSSNGHPGMGQLDIFSCIYKNGRWTKVSNLKPPINSIGDDFGITLDSSGENGFFSSDRFGGIGSEDIYAFSFDLPLELNFHPSMFSFNDFNLYNGLRYKMSVNTNETNRELIPRNGKFRVLTDNDSTYMLTVRKAIMVYNSIEITKEEHNTSNKIIYTISTSEKELRIRGSLFEEAKFNDMPVYLLNIEDNEVLLIDSINNGSFSYSNNLKISKTYKLIIGNCTQTELKSFATIPSKTEIIETDAE
jgi:tetratricopeptide (TPR) repeat protein